MVRIGRSLLSAFHRIKSACVRDTALSVVQHIAEVNLNQPLLSGVSVELAASEFPLYFMSDKLPTSAVICYLNNASVGIVKLRQL